VGIGQFTAAESVLSKSKHAVIKILHSQRFFNDIINRLVKGVTDSKSVETQSPYLVALTCLLHTVPKATYMDKLPVLLPLLLRGLMLQGSDIKANVIDTLLVVAEEDSIRQSAIAGHVSTLLTSMLNVLKADDASSVGFCHTHRDLTLN
jgi:DNA repair/transcription protein MET18/MMS19